MTLPYPNFGVVRVNAVLPDPFAPTMNGRSPVSIGFTGGSPDIYRIEISIFFFLPTEWSSFHMFKLRLPGLYGAGHDRTKVNESWRSYSRKKLKRLSATPRKGLNNPEQTTHVLPCRFPAHPGGLVGLPLLSTPTNPSGAARKSKLPTIVPIDIDPADMPQLTGKYS